MHPKTCQSSGPITQYTPSREPGGLRLRCKRGSYHFHQYYSHQRELPSDTQLLRRRTVLPTVKMRQDLSLPQRPEEVQSRCGLVGSAEATAPGWMRV